MGGSTMAGAPRGCPHGVLPGTYCDACAEEHTGSGDTREQVKLSMKIYEEFSSELERLLPNLNDVLVLAATKVAREHFHPRNHNMEFLQSMSIHNNDNEIVIRIKK